MENLIKDTKNIWISLGKIKNKIPKVEKVYKKFSRSIYIAENISKNEILSSKNIKIIRPGFGLSPSYYDKVIGKKAKKNLYKGNPLEIENFI